MPKMNCIKKNYISYLSTIRGLQFLFLIILTAGILGILCQTELNKVARGGQGLLWVVVVSLLYLTTVLFIKICAGQLVFNEAATFGLHTAFFVAYFIFLIIWGIYDAFAFGLMPDIRKNEVLIWVMMFFITITYLIMVILDFKDLYFEKVKEQMPDMPEFKKPEFKKPEFKKPEFKKPSLKAMKEKMPKVPKFGKRSKSESDPEKGDAGVEEVKAEVPLAPITECEVVNEEPKLVAPAPVESDKAEPFVETPIVEEKVAVCEPPPTPEVAPEPAAPVKEEAPVEVAEEEDKSGEEAETEALLSTVSSQVKAAEPPVATVATDAATEEAAAPAEAAAAPAETAPAAPETA